MQYSFNTQIKSAYKLIERMAEQLSKTNYYTARTYYFYNLHRADRRYEKSPLLVYQMGKVGSKTVVNSLLNAKIDRRIYHVHFLTPERIEEYENRRRKYLGTTREGSLKHIWQYRYLRKKIATKLDGDRWKVITLIRDPVARNLATFFENIEVVSVDSDQRWHLYSPEYEFRISVHKDQLDELIELFFEKCRHDAPLEYFDREIKSVLNVDVYATDFPRSKGFKLYHGKDVDLLLIRLENLNDCAEEAFNELLGISNIALVNKNIGEIKDYADLYKGFKDYIRLPEAYLEKMYSSKTVKHFYLESEIDRFKERWFSTRGNQN